MQCVNIVPTVRRIEDELEKIPNLVKWAVKRFNFILPVNTPIEDLIHEIQLCYFRNAKVWSSSYVISLTKWVILNKKKTALAMESGKEQTYIPVQHVDYKDACEEMLDWPDWTEAQRGYIRAYLTGKSGSEIAREIGVTRQRIDVLKARVLQRGKEWANQIGLS